MIFYIKNTYFIMTEIIPKESSDIVSSSNPLKGILERQEQLLNGQIDLTEGMVRLAEKVDDHQAVNQPILEDRDMLFDYLDTPTVSVDFIDLLVEKTNEMYQEGKTEDEIDQKIKK